MARGRGWVLRAGALKSVFRGKRRKAYLTAAVAAVVVLALGAGGAYAAVRLMAPGPRPDGTALTPYGWMVTPAGRQVALGEKPFGSALSPDGRTLLISNDGMYQQSISVVDTRTGKVRQSLLYDWSLSHTPYVPAEALFVGLAFSPDGAHAYASAGGNNKIRVYDVRNDRTLVEAPAIQLPARTYTDASGKVRPVDDRPAGLAVSADGRTLWAANSDSDSVSVVDLATAAVTIIPAGANPYAVALSPDGRTAYVSNWGGTSLTTIDTATRTPKRSIKVGQHPSALKVNRLRSELYVANTDGDTVSVIDLKTGAVARTIDLAPYPGAPVGSSPNAFALSPRGDTLYVANAGASALDVIALGDRRQSDRIAGRIPTGWYPAAVDVSLDGKTIFVANAKSLGAGPNPQGSNPYGEDLYGPGVASLDDHFFTQYSGSMIMGTLSIIARPDSAKLAQYTDQVAQNNHYAARGRVETAGAGTQKVIPTRVGDSSPIKHVIYVIKENRTYDQVLGSLGKGNGDPDLDLFDDASAPNHRALARQFVTLDNFYAAAEISEDGWYWSTAANANTYIEKIWPAIYGLRNLTFVERFIPDVAAPGRTLQSSYLWNGLASHGVSFRNFGWWCLSYEPVGSNAPNLAANTDPTYPGWNLDITDQTRMDAYATAFAGFVEAGAMPTVQFMRLPSDHTQGTVPGKPTPKAMVADNDLALGRLVQMVSHSEFWKDTAIFVVEDDAQDGPDHVDAHRTVALVISPYTQTGKVDSTFYSTVSMLRTIELIVGIPPLTQFDASATPMFKAFTNRPLFSSYDLLTPAQSLTEINALTAPMAAESAQLDFSKEDLADEYTLNLAVWQSVRGAGSSMPAPIGADADDD